MNTTWVLMAWDGEECWHPLCTFDHEPTWLERARAWVELEDHLPWPADREHRRYQVDTYGWPQSVQSFPVPHIERLP